MLSSIVHDYDVVLAETLLVTFGDSLRARSLPPRGLWQLPAYLKHYGVNLFLDFIISKHNTILRSFNHQIQEGQTLLLT
jgi:hypothetical protein